VDGATVGTMTLIGNKIGVVNNSDNWGTDAGNNYGIMIGQMPHGNFYIGDNNIANYVGGTTVSNLRNIISGNSYNGISIENGNSAPYPDVTIKNNYVGLGGDGDTVLANGNYGLYVGNVVVGATHIMYIGADGVDNDGDAIVDEPNEGDSNVISGNGMAGIALNAVYGDFNIMSNYIGTDSGGTLARGNNTGVAINIPSGGAYTNDINISDNTISGNDFYGVMASITDSGTSASLILQNNYIGVSSAGDQIGNGDAGVYVDYSDVSTTVMIGGLGVGEGNVISANGNSVSTEASSNIKIDDRCTFGDVLCSRPLIAGNKIGTDPNGNLNNPINNGLGSGSFPTPAPGVFISRSFNGIDIIGNTIAFSGGDGIKLGDSIGPRAGASTIQDNVIVANGEYGINVDFTYNVDTQIDIKGNYIGTSNDGISSVGMSNDSGAIRANSGILVVGGYNNLYSEIIGIGDDIGDGNVIAGNGLAEDKDLITITGDVLEAYFYGNVIGLTRADEVSHYAVNAGHGGKAIKVDASSLYMLMIGAVDIWYPSHGSDSLDDSQARNVISGRFNGASAYWQEAVDVEDVCDEEVTIGNPGYCSNLLQKSYITLVNNYIGTNWSGNGAVPCADCTGSNINSINILDGDDVRIGGEGQGDGNVISKTTDMAIGLDIVNPVGHLADVWILGNIIGLASDGSLWLGNEGNGIEIGTSGMSGTVVIGDTLAAGKNIIGGSAIDGQGDQSGILVQNTGDLDLTVYILENYIGVNALGNAAIANEIGVKITGGTVYLGEAQNATVTTNIISGNSVAGILVDHTSGFLNVSIRGAYIGTDLAGASAIPNGGSVSNFGDSAGVVIWDKDNVVPSDDQVLIQGNLISGNVGNGVMLIGGDNITVDDNAIGINLAASAALPNIVSANSILPLFLRGSGILIADNFGIGANASVVPIISNNTIAGNEGSEVAIFHYDQGGTGDITVTQFGPNNYIGTIDGVTDLDGEPVGGNGVAFYSTSALYPVGILSMSTNIIAEGVMFNAIDISSAAIDDIYFNNTNTWVSYVPGTSHYVEKFDENSNLVYFLPTQCNDGVDNDGDGYIDMADSGCTDVSDDNETNSQCSNGIDDDVDGLIDMLDLGCMDPSDNDEFTPEIVGPTPCTDPVYSEWGACNESMRFRTLDGYSPQGCSGGIEPLLAPVLSEACTLPCTDFLYTDWTPAECDQTGIQTREVSMGDPLGCVGGAVPVLEQACEPPPLVCETFTYSEWSECAENGIQSREIISSSPVNCIGGTPEDLTQACVYGPICGNYIIEGGETCDDGNTSNGDGCSSICEEEGGVVMVIAPPPPPPPTSEIVCPSGTTKQGISCVPVPVVCPSGYTVSGDDCIKNEILCTTGFRQEGDQCVPITCGVGYFLSGNSCLKTVCTGDQCGPKKEPVKEQIKIAVNTVTDYVSTSQGVTAVLQIDNDKCKTDSDCGTNGSCEKSSEGLVCVERKPLDCTAANGSVDANNNGIPDCLDTTDVKQESAPSKEAADKVVFGLVGKEPEKPSIANLDGKVVDQWPLILVTYKANSEVLVELEEMETGKKIVLTKSEGSDPNTGRKTEVYVTTLVESKSKEDRTIEIGRTKVDKEFKGQIAIETPLPAGKYYATPVGSDGVRGNRVVFEVAKTDMKIKRLEVLQEKNNDYSGVPSLVNNVLNVIENVDDSGRFNTSEFIDYKAGQTKGRKYRVYAEIESKDKEKKIVYFTYKSVIYSSVALSDVSEDGGNLIDVPVPEYVPKNESHILTMYVSDLSKTKISSKKSIQFEMN